MLDPKKKTTAVKGGMPSIKRTIKSVRDTMKRGDRAVGRALGRKGPAVTSSSVLGKGRKRKSTLKGQGARVGIQPIKTKRVVTMKAAPAKRRQSANLRGRNLR